MATKKTITVNGETWYKSIYTTDYSPVYISDYMSGKMEGIPAISTSCLLNPFCRARAKDPNSICAHCYSEGTINRYSELSRHLEENTELLKKIIPAGWLPRFKKTVGIVRFEAFGDLLNVEHAINYFRIAAANPHVQFALWTKNKGIIRRAVESVHNPVGKPANIELVYSANKVNGPEPLPLYFDKVFVVWESEKKCLEDGYHGINCGARACGDCGICYLDKEIALINELKKNRGGKKNVKH